MTEPTKRHRKEAVTSLMLGVSDEIQSYEECGDPGEHEHLREADRVARAIADAEDAAASAFVTATEKIRAALDEQHRREIDEAEIRGYVRGRLGGPPVPHEIDYPVHFIGAWKFSRQSDGSYIVRRIAEVRRG